jgi:hypothetical protein
MVMVVKINMPALAGADAIGEPTPEWQFLITALIAPMSIGAIVAATAIS